MISHSRQSVSAADQKNLKALFEHQGWEALLRLLAHEEAAFQAEALMEIRKFMGKLVRESDIPESAKSRLHRAANFTVARTILLELSKDGAVHSQTKLSIE